MLFLIICPKDDAKIRKVGSEAKIFEHCRIGVSVINFEAVQLFTLNGPWKER